MIRIVMLGRLGNNLFQYALGRALSEKHDVPFVMDGSWFNSDGWSQVNCIKRFPGPAAGKVKIVRRCSLGARTLLKLTGKHYWEYLSRSILREDNRDQSFNPAFLNAPSDCILFGYFQTPRYFQGIETALRQELSTHDLGLELGCEAIAERLRASTSVAIHVRRGDYVGNPNLEVCGIDYYQNAMSEMRARSANTKFFIFSDDSSWCEKHLNQSDAEIIHHSRNQSPLVDLHLMSLARHNIIANSSYSWWAAWLGKKADQHVIAPSQWFKDIRAPIEEKLSQGWKSFH
jgi:Glycosyl transferase family 11